MKFKNLFKDKWLYINAIIYLLLFYIISVSLRKELDIDIVIIKAIICSLLTQSVVMMIKIIKKNYRFINKQIFIYYDYFGMYLYCFVITGFHLF